MENILITCDGIASNNAKLLVDGKEVSGITGFTFTCHVGQPNQLSIDYLISPKNQRTPLTDALA